jgi:hypothetical protein
MCRNWVVERRTRLAARIYIRRTDGYEDTVFFEASKVARYRRRWEGEFNLIVAGSAQIEDDFYVFPYREIEHMLTEENVKVQQDDRRRWQLRIRNGILQIGNNQMEVGQWYGVRVDLADGVSLVRPLGRAGG